MASLFFFVIQHAVAEALKIGVCDLLFELGAHAFGLGRTLKTAGAIAARHFEALPDMCYNFLVGIFFDLHMYLRA